MSLDSPRDFAPRSEEQYRHDICLVGRWLYERGHIVAGEGNLSLRLDGNRILTTPTCLNKGMMSPDDLVTMDLNGRHLHGDRQVSSEAGMHLLFYQMRPGRTGGLPRPSAHRDWFCGRGSGARSGTPSRSGRLPRQGSASTLRNSRYF